MIPANALSSQYLNWPIKKEISIIQKDLPVANCTQMKLNATVSVKQSILHIITTRNLRSAHLIRFTDERTDWTIYKPSYSILSEEEVRGSLAFAIKEVQHGSFSLLRKTKIKSKTFIKSTQRIVSDLERVKEDEKIFIILVFENYSFVSGNFYDESTLCRALLNYCPSQEQNVISKVREDAGQKQRLPFVVPEDLSRPSAVRIS